jgi:predicted ATPase
MSQENQEKLNRIIIKGYKSIKDCELNLKDINVLIGSNGAGKSNFISVFELLHKIQDKSLAGYVQIKGATSLLYNGAKVTNGILVEFYFAQNIYSFELEITENNSFIIVGESIGSVNSPLADGDYNESKLQEWLYNPKIDRSIVETVLRKPWRSFHFYDKDSIIKPRNYNISNCEALHKDSSNLAAFLYRLKLHYELEYKSILHAVQMVAPYFKDFVLKPEEGNEEHIILRWQKKDCEDVFNAAQFSDGTLRFICLAVLLLQPTELQPATIIIDEPELGLHPFAITIFVEMVQKAAVNKQIIIATQSVELLDNFDVEDVVVVDNNENGTEFKRLDAEQLKLWLENDYTLGELWNKNIFGGRP